MDAPRELLPSLPDNAEALRALVLAALAERDAVASERDAAVVERDALLAQNDRLRHLLLKLTRMHFGARSERLPEEQLQLGLEALEQAIAKEDAQAEKQDAELRRDNTAKRRASRGALPAHLPRIEVTLTPEDTACPCCRTPMTVIGVDTSERLDVIPAQFRVVVTKRPKLACRSCAGTVVQAPAPARLIEGGIPTEALVAHVLVARYADHLPLYRQAQIMARQGVSLERSTLSFWTGYAAAEVAPVVARLREMLLQSTRLFADETVVPVLDPGRGRTKQGYFWAIARDDRPWGGDQPPAVVYSYAPGRGHSHANTLLGGYRGILQCDGYGAYKKFGGAKSTDPPVTLAFCWSHTIRTQSNVCGRLQFVPRHMTTQRDDMLDLQGVVVDDDALDDQPQDGLTLAEISGSQPATDTLAERGQASECFVCLEPLLVKAALPVILLLRQLAPLEECSSLAG
jgi:transposase